MLDLLIFGGTIIDGSGAPRFEADVGVRGGRIVFVGQAQEARSQTSAATRRIDASGLVVAPGFIDCHTHDDRALLSDPEMVPKVSQGVTTVVTGNCGISLAPTGNGLRFPPAPPLDLLDPHGEWFRFATFAAYAEALRAQPAAIHAAPLIGHSTLRLACMDRVDREATPDEIAKMRALVVEALASGAIGCSSGLYYEPAAAASTEEVIEVFAPMREYGGIYCAHMRDEGEHIIASIEEVVRIGDALGVPAVISHHKLAGTPNHGRSSETLALIDSLRRRGPGDASARELCLDCYPYAASSTILSEGRAAVASKVLVTWSIPHPEHNGRDLAQIAKEQGVSRADAIRSLLPAGAIYFAMHEDDVQRILAFEQTMIGSDGLPHDARAHPRLWGTFPRVLGHYSRDLNLFPLETAVRKMSGLTARNFGLIDRGEIRVGAFADITLFDAASIVDLADFDDSARLSRGIDSVFVEGVAVWERGRSTGARPGRMLRRAPKPGGTASAQTSGVPAASVRSAIVRGIDDGANGDRV